MSKISKSNIVWSVVCAVLITFCFYFGLGWKEEKKEKDKLIFEKKKVEIELKVYKNSVKDEVLQKQIDDGVDSVRNAIDFFGGGADSL
jgi:predicted membrane protein